MDEEFKKNKTNRGAMYAWSAYIVDHKIISLSYMLVSFLFGGIIVEELRNFVSGVVTDYVKRCNELATDPTDANRDKDFGIELVDVTPDAVGFCKQAVERHPSSRLRYQYARAIEKFGTSADAEKLYQPLADDGYVAAQIRLGALLVSFPERCQEGRHYIEIAASKNSSEATLALGRLYYKGLGVKKDQKKGIDLIESSARDGNSHAMRYLGMLKSELQK